MSIHCNVDVEEEYINSFFYSMLKDRVTINRGTATKRNVSHCLIDLKHSPLITTLVVSHSFTARKVRCWLITRTLIHLHTKIATTCASSL